MSLIDLSAETEISELDVTLKGEKHVVGLDITMNDSFGMEVLKSM